MSSLLRSAWKLLTLTQGRFSDAALRVLGRKPACPCGRSHDAPSKSRGVGNAVLADVYVRPRTIRLPEKCWGCGTVFTRYNPIRISEFQGQTRPGRVTEEDGRFKVYGAFLPDGGARFISYTGYSCAYCGRILAEGEYHEEGNPEVRPAQG